MWKCLKRKCNIFLTGTKTFWNLYNPQLLCWLWECSTWFLVHNSMSTVSLSTVAPPLHLLLLWSWFWVVACACCCLPFPDSDENVEEEEEEEDGEKDNDADSGMPCPHFFTHRQICLITVPFHPCLSSHSHVCSPFFLSHLRRLMLDWLQLWALGGWGEMKRDQTLFVLLVEYIICWTE